MANSSSSFFLVLNLERLDRQQQRRGKKNRMEEMTIRQIFMICHIRSDSEVGVVVVRRTEETGLVDQPLGRRRKDEVDRYDNVSLT